MATFNEINPESFYYGFSEPENGGDGPEEETCSKCLELIEECDCDDYEVHPLFNEILAIVRPPESKKRKVRKLVNK